MSAATSRRGCAHAATLSPSSAKLTPLPPAPIEPWTGVVDLRALHAAAHGSIGAHPLQAAMDATGGALTLAQALEASTPAPRLWLVTAGAQPVQHRGGDLALAQSPLWGLGRVIALERPELRATLVDLDPTPPESAETLAAELLTADAEQLVAWRGGVRFVPRLAPGSAGPGAPGAAALRLDVAPRGVLDNLAWVTAERTAPGRGQVEIQVDAIGLNFRDVLNALGMYPGDAGPAGR